jgi:hypothetical protein
MTAQKPRFPKRVWLYLRCTFQPLPDAPPDVTPIQLEWNLSARHDGRGFYTVDTSTPLAWIQHTIDADNGSTDTAGTITAHLATHQPYHLGPLMYVVPTKWHPYRVPLDIPAPPLPALDAPPDQAYWDSRPPSERLPEALASSKKPTGPYADRILERRATGPRARAQALARPTPSPKQQLQQARFQLAKTTWTDWPYDNRAAWNFAADQLRLKMTGWNLFLRHVLNPDPAEFARLQARTVYTLPAPPVLA